MGLTLDDVIPRPDFSSQHELWIAAPPPAVWEALRTVRLGGTPLSRTLMGIRLLPMHLAGRHHVWPPGSCSRTAPFPSSRPSPDDPSSPAA